MTRDFEVPRLRLIRFRRFTAPDSLSRESRIFARCKGMTALPPRGCSTVALPDITAAAGFCMEYFSALLTQAIRTARWKVWIYIGRKIFSRWVSRSIPWYFQRLCSQHCLSADYHRPHLNQIRLVHPRNSRSQPQ